MFKRLSSYGGKIIVVLLCIGLCSCQTTPAPTYPPMESYPAPVRGRVLTAEEVAADAMWLVNITEETHPIFLDIDQFEDWDDTEYRQRKEDFLQKATTSMTVGEFQLLCSYYTSGLRDAHFTVQSPPAGDGPMPGGRLFLSFRWDETGLQLLPDDVHPEGAMVLSINGMDVEEIGQSMDLYSAYENESGRYFFRSNNAASRTMHQVAGMETEETAKLQLLLPDGTEEAYVVPYETVNLSGGSVDSWSFALIEDGSIGLLTSNVCVRDEKMAEALGAMKKATETGVSQYVVDVRENQGGDMTVWNDFAEALALTQNLSYGYVRRYSPLLKSRNTNYSKVTEEFTLYEPRCITSGAINWDLVVLSSEKTFSAAVMLVGYFEDGELGTVIGRTPRNTLSFFSSPCNFALPISNLQARVSTQYMLRPDASRDMQADATVDIEVPYGGDALQVAIAFLTTS